MNTKRRDILKKTLLLGAAGTIMSLLPEDARAAGSWSNNQQRPFGIPEPYSKRYVVPFSNDWRNERGNYGIKKDNQR